MNYINTLFFLFILSFNSFVSASTPFNTGFENIEFKFNCNYGDIVSVELNEEENTLSFSTISQIGFVQILNSEGKLEYQLPIYSNDVTIDLDDFETGKFQINLLVGNNQNMISSTFEK